MKMTSSIAAASTAETRGTLASKGDGKSGDGKSTGGSGGFDSLLKALGGDASPSIVTAPANTGTKTTGASRDPLSLSQRILAGRSSTTSALGAAAGTATDATNSDGASHRSALIDPSNILSPSAKPVSASDTAVAKPLLALVGIGQGLDRIEPPARLDQDGESTPGDPSPSPKATITALSGRDQTSDGSRSADGRQTLTQPDASSLGLASWASLLIGSSRIPPQAPVEQGSGDDSALRQVTSRQDLATSPLPVLSPLATDPRAAATSTPAKTEPANTEPANTDAASESTAPSTGLPQTESPANRLDQSSASAFQAGTLVQQPDAAIVVTAVSVSSDILPPSVAVAMRGMMEQDATPVWPSDQTINAVDRMAATPGAVTADGSSTPIIEISQRQGSTVAPRGGGLPTTDERPSLEPVDVASSPAATPMALAQAAQPTAAVQPSSNAKEAGPDPAGANPPSPARDLRSLAPLSTRDDPGPIAAETAQTPVLPIAGAAGIAGGATTTDPRRSTSASGLEQQAVGIAAAAVSSPGSIPGPIPSMPQRAERIGSAVTSAAPSMRSGPRTSARQPMSDITSTASRPAVDAEAARTSGLASSTETNEPLRETLAQSADPSATRIVSAAAPQDTSLDDGSPDVSERAVAPQASAVVASGDAAERPDHGAIIDATAPSAPSSDAVTPGLGTAPKALSPVAQAIVDVVAAQAPNVAGGVEPAAAAAAAPARTMTLQFTQGDAGSIAVRMHLTGHALDLRVAVSDKRTFGIVDRERDALATALRSEHFDLRSLEIQGGDNASSLGGNNGQSQDGGRQNAGSQGTGSYLGREAGSGTGDSSGGNAGGDTGRRPAATRRVPDQADGAGPGVPGAASGTLFV